MICVYLIVKHVQENANSFIHVVETRNDDVVRTVIKMYKKCRPVLKKKSFSCSKITKNITQSDF